MKRILLVSSVLALMAAPAHANLKMTLVVPSCTNGGDTPWRETDNKGRLGRLRVTDQTGAVVLAQPNVHFTAIRCKSTLTASFTTAVLLRFLNPDDPLFITLEVCKSEEPGTCTMDPSVQLDGKPVAFSNLPIDSVLPEISREVAEGIEVERQARIAADDAELTRATTAESGERSRAQTAESTLNNGLNDEINRATAAENAITAALNSEVGRATGAEGAEKTAREQADQAERAYADGTFVRKAGDTITGDLTINGVLRLKGGISWEQCPVGLNSLEHTFASYQGTTNRLCASEVLTTPPSVRLDELLASYIEPICPMVTRVVQNYATIGGPAAIAGINLLLGQLGPIITNQLLPLVTGTLQAGATTTNGVVDSLNNTIGVLNAAAASNVATVNTVIGAYNQLVVNMNGALTTSTQGINGAIGGVNSGFSSVHTGIGLVVGAINLSIGDVNGAFAAINSTLGSASTTFNNFNNNPAGINAALSAFDSDINARIDALNAMVDGINTAQTGTVNGINGAIGQLNSGFSGLNSNIGGVVNGVNGAINGVNGNIDAALQQSIEGANYVLGQALSAVNNQIIGPLNCNTAPFGTINGFLCFIDDVIDVINGLTVGLADIPHTAFVPHASPIQPLVALNNPSHVSGLSYGASAPSVGTLSAPAQLSPLSYVQPHSVGSLGLPTLNLGLTASMRTVPYEGSAPTVATVTAPQITGANLAQLSPPVGIPTLPYVTAPQIPTFTGFNLIGAVDFNGLSGLITSAISPICADLQGTAQSYLQLAVGAVPALVPSHGDAEEACGSRGAHVCTESEISVLVGDDLPSTHGFAFGDWAGNRVVLNDHAVRGFMLAADWPFIKVDASKLMSFPPGFPFTFTPPVIPSGRFRCCASSTAFN